MNILFISQWLDTRPNGARQCSRAHHAALSNLWGGVSVISVMSDRNYTAKNTPNKTFIRGTCSKMDTLRNIFTGHTGIYGSRAEQHIMNIIKENHFDCVWVDDRDFGSTVRRIKRTWPSLTVIAFYHGVREIELNAKNFRSPINMMGMINRIRQEKISARYADANVVLNNRDADLLYKHYGVKADLLLPICFIDSANIKHVPAEEDNFNILFVGGAFLPNVDGISWFAEKVMPFLDERAVLNIVGRGMDSLKELPQFRSSRVKVFGYVENLDDCYNSADLVIAPIRYGWGMKTKIAEALMYGKNFLGTTEAFEGYEGFHDLKCNTPDEFIMKINCLIASGCERYNPDMRKLYEDKYSIKAMEKTLRDFLGRMMKK